MLQCHWHWSIHSCRVDLWHCHHKYFLNRHIDIDIRYFPAGSILFCWFPVLWCHNEKQSLWLLLWISLGSNGINPAIRGQNNNITRTLLLTHWGRVTHKCVSKLTITGLDNGLSPGRRQAIIWTNVGILLIWPLGTNFSEILIEIYTFSFKKIHLKMLSGNGGHFVSASMS